MDPQTRITLFRHGEVEGINPPQFRGRLDLELTPRGVIQAERTRDYLKSLGTPEAIYTSPMERCQRTARIIGDSCGIAPRFTAELNDIDYGDWQGKTHEEVRQNDPERLQSGFALQIRCLFRVGKASLMLSGEQKTLGEWPLQDIRVRPRSSSLMMLSFVS